jgi:hypothetical protein
MHHARSGLLLASLQRVYQPDGGALPEGTAFSKGNNGRPARVAPAIESGAHTMEGVWDVNDLDPLPFVSQRNELSGSKQPSQLQASGTESADTVIPRDGALPIPAGGESAASSDRATAHDRRKLPRRDSDCAVLICTHKGNERPTAEKITWMLHAAKTRGHLLDVSMSGVALSVVEQFKPGTRVALRISNRALSKHVDASATVLRCREEGGEWHVVCRFDKNLTFEQIHLIGRNLFASTIV